MSNQALGNIPALGRMSLIDGQDFSHTFTTVAELPQGSTVSLELLDAARTYSYGSWPVVNLVSRIDAADHAVVPDGSWFRLWVTYPSNGGRFCWIAGPVERNRR